MGDGREEGEEGGRGGGGREGAAPVSRVSESAVGGLPITEAAGATEARNSRNTPSEALSFLHLRPNALPHAP